MKTHLSKIKRMRSGALCLAAVMAALCLCAGLTGGARAVSLTTPVTLAELQAFGEQLRTAALSSEPLAESQADAEGGYEIPYEFATLYAAEPSMAADTALTAAVVADTTVPGPRGTTLDARTAELLRVFPSENPELDGSRERALLYLNGSLEAGFTYGLALRDGQRIRYLEYGEFAREGDGYRSGALLYTVQADLVTSIRAEFPAPAGAEDAALRWEDLTGTKAETGYRQVASSLNGKELAIFGPSDLVFGGVDYRTAQPDSFGGMPEDVLMEDEDGRWLRVVDGDGYNAVFTCDRDGNNAVLISYTILDEDLEGPRAVRLGDLFHEDFCRFRNGEHESDGVTELLYGADGVAPYGKAEYADADGMTLRYVTPAGDGREVELYLHYNGNELREIILHTL